jgi:hypothetical protein
LTINLGVETSWDGSHHDDHEEGCQSGIFFHFSFTLSHLALSCGKLRQTFIHLKATFVYRTQRLGLDTFQSWLCPIKQQPRQVNVLSVNTALKD